MEELKLLGTDHSAQDNQALADEDGHHRPKPAAFPQTTVSYSTSLQEAFWKSCSPAFPTPHHVHLRGANSGKSGVNQAISRRFISALALWQDVDAGLEPEGPACASKPLR